MARSCLTKKDIALSEAALKKSRPVSESKQKLIEKQEKMFYALNKDAEFQKSLVGLTKKDTINAYWDKIKANGVNITRRKSRQILKDGVTIAKPSSIVIPKRPPGVKPSSIVIPKKPPKIVSTPKETPSKIIPIKPMPEELLTEFREAKTLDEALEEFKKYGSNNPMTGEFAKGWNKKKQLKTMNEINAQMNQMERWTRGRKLGRVSFIDGDKKLGGSVGINQSMDFNYININYRTAFRKFGDREKGVGSLQKIRKVVSGGNSSVVLRHEMGHALWYDDRSAMGSKRRLEFTNRTKTINKQVIKRNISEYAATNSREFFAESFAIYSSPKYKMGTLNKAFGDGFEELMEKILISDRKLLQVAKPLVQIAKPLTKKVVKKGVKFARSVDQKVYDNFYNDYMKDSKLKTATQLAEKLDEDISANVRSSIIG